MKPEDLEAYKAGFKAWQAQQTQKQRKSVGQPRVQAPAVVEPSVNPQPQTLQLRKTYGDKTAVLDVKPHTAPHNGITDEVTRASQLRLEFTMTGYNTVYRFVEFPAPVTITDHSILMPAPRGRDRMGRPQGGYQRFDPWVAFEGSKEAKRTVKDLKSKGVRFIKPEAGKL